jgi:TonB family protein
VKQRSIAGIGALALFLATGSLEGQTVPIEQRTTPLPEGRRIDARDGDLIVVDDNARVRFVRRRSAVGRLIFNAAERWVVLLADFVPANGTADGTVDFSYNWRQIEGTWPIEERWEGTLVIEDYMSPGFAPNSIGLVLPGGRIQFFSGSPARDTGFVDPNPLAILIHRSAGSTSGNRLTFDEAEPKALAEVAANARNSSGSVAVFGAQGVTGSLSFTSTASGRVSSDGPQGQAPVRTGGPVPTPRKVHDVPPVYPEAMRQSGVAGVVILEVIVAADGSVSGVKVLRGLAPQIDLAALEAAKQWRYEPTHLNGLPVSVVLTATVNVRP